MKVIILTLALAAFAATACAQDIDNGIRVLEYTYNGIELDTQDHLYDGIHAPDNDNIKIRVASLDENEYMPEFNDGTIQSDGEINVLEYDGGAIRVLEYEDTGIRVDATNHFSDDDIRVLEYVDAKINLASVDENENMPEFDGSIIQVLEYDGEAEIRVLEYDNNAIHVDTMDHFTDDEADMPEFDGSDIHV